MGTDRGMLSLSDHEVFLVPAQFPTIQEAIDAVTRPVTIVVAPGMYSESLRINAKAYLVIQSSKLGKRGVTISGQSGPGVVSIEQSVAHFSGIEVRSNGRLRGFLIVDSSVTFQECIVAGNRISDGSADPLGAGMLCRSSTVRIQKSTVAGNTVDGGASAEGGGLYFADCKVEIAGSSIQANAVYADAQARGGGIWCERSDMRMWRSRVTDNALHAGSCDGAGIYFKDPGDTQLGGSIVTGNGSVDGRGGGIFIDGDATRIAIHRNTVVHQNHPDDVFVRVAN
jgi:hypothetical protein